MQTMFFFYGLAFLMMGGTIFLMPKKKDPLGLSEDLWMVGAFGLVHGLNEWVDLFILRGGPFNVETLKILGVLLLPLSFVFLVSFGTQILFRKSRFFQYVRYAWLLLFMGWAAACFFSPDFLIAGVLARYFIGLPGTWLTAAGLIYALVHSEEKRLPRAVFLSVVITAGTFFIYGLFSGLVVSPADFLFASYINYTTFGHVFGVPVQFFRMLCAIALAFSFLGVAGEYFYDRDSKKVPLRGGIKYKIALLLCAFSCGAALLTGGIIYFWVHHSLLGAVRQEQLGVTRLLSRSVGQMVEEEIKALHTYTGSNYWREFVGEANKPYAGLEPAAIVKDLLGKEEQWRAAGENSPWVQEFLATSMSQRLKNLSLSDKDTTEIFLTDREGKLIAASRKTKDLYYADEFWWQKAYFGGRGNVFVGPAEMDEGTGILSFSVAVPVRDEKGALIGLCRKSIDMEPLFGTLKAFKKGKSGHAAMIDAQGKVLYHEGLDPLSTQLFTETEIRRLSKKGAGLIREAVSIHPERSLASIQRLENATLENNGVEWFLVVLEQEEEAFAPLKRLAILIAVALLLAVTGSVLLGLSAGERFSKPVQELDRAVQKVLSGGWEDVKIHTGDEVQVLAESFNRMVESLHRRQKELLEAKEKTETRLREFETKEGGGK